MRQRSTVPSSALIAVCIAAGSAFCQEDTLVDNDGEPSFGGGVEQIFSWSDGADPAWAHTTSFSLAWTPAGRPLGLDEARVGMDLVGEGFQFDSLWAIEPTAGLSSSWGIATLETDAWVSVEDGDTLSNMGIGSRLAFELFGGPSNPVSINLFGSLSDASGSDIGGGLGWTRPGSRVSTDAAVSVARKWDVDMSAMAQNLPRRLVVTDRVGDQWQIASRSGARVRLGDFGIGARLSLSATRSELDVERTNGKKSSRSSTSTLWALDISPSLRASWSRGIFDIRGTLGSSSDIALSSKGETEAFQPWGLVAFGVSW